MRVKTRVFAIDRSVLSSSLVENPAKSTASFLADPGQQPRIPERRADNVGSE